MKKQIWDFVKKGAKNIGKSIGKNAVEDDGQKESQGKGGKKKIILIIILIPIIFVWIVINIIQALFQAFVCNITFGLICQNKDDKTEDAITDQEVKDIAEKMRSLRAQINAEIAAGGGTPGENYSFLTPGGFDGSSYNTSCGPYSGENADVINRAAQKNNVEPQLVAAFAKQETQIRHFNADGTVIRNKASGATGMMQLMPATAAWLGVDAYDLEQNVDGGARYIAMMKEERNGNIPLALASYNWGPGNVNKELRRLGATTWEQVIAKGGGNKETNNYVVKVMKYFEEFKGSSGSCEGSGSADGTMSAKYNSENESKVTASLLDSYLGGTLKGLGQAYIDYGKQYGVEPAFLAALSKHETGNGTSDLSKDSRHNLGGIKCPSAENKEKFGITCSSGQYATFPSLEKSLEYKAYLIKNSYIDKGKDTVGSIQKTYCPDGDGQCGVWVKNVTGYMNEIYSKAGVEVKGDPPKLDDTTEGEGVDDEGDKEDATGDGGTGTEAGSNEGSELGKKMAAGAIEMWKKYSKDLGVADPIYYEFAGGRSSKTAVVDTRRGDCSAFTAYVARTYGGVSINMTAATQGQNGKVVFDANMLQPGDLVLFKAGSGYQGSTWTDPNGKTYHISHVGMYVGNGEFVHLHGPSLSKSTKAKAGTISKNKTTESYFRGHFVAGIRIGESGQVGEPNQVAAGEDSTDEALLHLQTLIQIDQYALSGLDLTDKNIEKEYKDTNIYKMWKLAKKLDRKGEKNWTNYDYIMDARALVYECFLVGNEHGWFFKDKPCNEIADEFAIPEEHQAVLLHTSEHTSYWWTCKKNADAKSASASVDDNSIKIGDGVGSGTPTAVLTNHQHTYDPKPKNPCGANETGELQEKTVKSIAYPDLKAILAMFEPYSLAQNKAYIIDKDESYTELLNFYLQQGYEEAGVSGEYSEVAQVVDETKLGKGSIAYPIANANKFISDTFGTRGGKHKGMDFASDRGTPIVSVEAGTVEEIRTGSNGSNGYGNLVIIKHNINGQTMYSKYAHVLNNEKDCAKCKDGGGYGDRKLSDYYDEEKKIQVKVGDQVTRGQVIAYMGNAAHSSNFHLHFEICAKPYDTSTCVDPQKLFDE